MTTDYLATAHVAAEHLRKMLEKATEGRTLIPAPEVNSATLIIGQGQFFALISIAESLATIAERTPVPTHRP